ncbi:Nn.00g000840.m01.CDS01 [Neocucurbitaria sp. VM-36]
MTIVPPGGLVLVTGANGYVGGITVQKLLDAGYRVRGTVRNASKHAWMFSHYGPNFSIVEVPDLGVDGALDEAVKGVDGIAHVASPTGESYKPDPQATIPHGIRCALSLLESAAKEPSVRSVVYTSSQAAALMQKPGEQYHITSTSWNEESKVAWTLPITEDFRRSLLNYMCAKTEAEQQSFKWVQDHKPQFTFNTIVPNINFGPGARPDKTGFITTSGMLKLIWQGNTLPAQLFQPQYFVDVEDTALLHVAVLTQQDVQNERIMAMSCRYEWNEVLDIFRKIAPDHTFPEKLDEILDSGTVDNNRAEELLRRVKDGKGWTPLEDSITRWSVQMLQAEKEGKDWPVSAVEEMAKAFAQLPPEQSNMYG